MCMYRKALVVLAGFALILGATASVNAVDLDEPSNWTGAKLGVLMSGTAEINDIEVDQKSTYSFSLFSDFPLGDYFHYGIAMDIMRMDWFADKDELHLDEAETMLDVSLNFKATLPFAGKRFALRPGVGIGYGVMRRREGFNGTNYLSLKAYTELAVMIGEKAVLIDAGIWDAPTGGDSDTDITIGPLTFVRAGIAF